jgi:hypothetical protein
VFLPLHLNEHQTKVDDRGGEHHAYAHLVPRHICLLLLVLLALALVLALVLDCLVLALLLHP